MTYCTICNRASCTFDMHSDEEREAWEAKIDAYRASLGYEVAPRDPERFNVMRANSALYAAENRQRYEQMMFNLNLCGPKLPETRVEREFYGKRHETFGT